jgi:stromal membrane-associated protein
MSRRAPNPGAERAAQNQATIKSLLKLEPNKVCADCKRNKRTSIPGGSHHSNASNN